MKKLVTGIALAVLMASGLLMPAVSVAAPDSQRKLVVFQSGVGTAAALDVLRGNGAVVQRQLANTPFTAFSAVVPAAAVPALERARGVARVEQDFVVEVAEAPDAGARAKPGPAPQPSETLSWGVNRIDADLAWSSSTGAGVNVAIIDTGISKTHPDLTIAGGVNYVVKKGSIDPTGYDDDNGHGSHVAGIVAAADNDIGVIGVAPSASLYAVKVLNSRGSGYMSDVIDGIYWAVNNSMKVINMSLGCDCPSTSLEDAVNAADAAGIVVVAAAGNSGTADGSGDTMIYPAKYSAVIAVAATDSSDQRASWSSTGPGVDIAAPGVSIKSTWKGVGYNTISGTSMASPHVAGAAALLVATGLNNVNTRAKLVGTADDLGASGSDTWFGNGLVDAQEAVTGVQTLP